MEQKKQCGGKNGNMLHSWDWGIIFRRFGMLISRLLKQGTSDQQIREMN
jgi:hypothetical protein